MANLSHKRDADARRFPRVPRVALVAAPLATVATLGAVSLGVVSASPSTGDQAAQRASAPLSARVDLDERRETVSRSNPDELPTVVKSGGKLAVDQARLRRLAAERAARETAAAVAAADTKLWTTADLNIWTASAGGTDLGLLEDGKRVLVTGREASGRTEIVLDGESRWVTSGYLDDEKPEPPAPAPAEESSGTEESGAAGLSSGCSNGTSVSGSANVLAVHDAVCAAFPSITSYGTYRSDGEHAQGIAIDIMVSGGTGWQVAEYIRSNYAQLGVNYIMYSQKIWSVDRSGEGWRYVEDRGSATANHYDHVHVTTY